METISPSVIMVTVWFDRFCMVTADIMSAKDDSVDTIITGAEALLIMEGVDWAIQTGANAAKSRSRLRMTI
jgi:hypothetical protein